MSNKNEVNEIFSFLAKGGEITGEKLTQIYQEIYHEKPEIIPPKSISKEEFQIKLGNALKQPEIDDELLYLFYQLDREKKGYLSPEDIMAMFKAVNKTISLNEVENSFKYAKIYKNKMTFEDFK